MQGLPRAGKTRRAFHVLRRGLIGLALLATAAAAHAQWDIATPPTTADLRGIDNVGKGVAWASGTGGTVVRTEDDGYLWQRCSIPPGAGHLDFRGIQAFDANTAIVMSSGKGPLSRLYKTSDGCQTWKLLFTNPDPEGFWDAIQLDSPKSANKEDSCLGLILGDPIGGRFSLFISLDCGENWERQKILPKALSGESAFAASNSSLSLAGGWRSFVTGGISGPRGLRFMTYEHFTAPDGVHPANPPPYQINTWFADALPQPNPSDTSGAFSIYASLSGAEIKTVVVGGDYRAADSQKGTAWYWGANPTTERSGFIAAQIPPHGYRSAVAYDDASKTWITVGPYGSDISTDDGRDWRALRPNPAFHDAPDADQHWNALSLPYAVGPHGRIGKLRPSALNFTGAKP